MDEFFEIADRAVRLDVFLADCTPYTRSRLQKLIADGAAFVNGTPAKSNTVLRIGDAVSLSAPELSESSVQAEDIPLCIVYEDTDLLVIDKPQGMVVHPAPGHSSGTLVNALLFHVSDLSGIGGEKRPGIVHRIDRMTSGLLAVAKNDEAHNSLSLQFAAHTAGRCYLAIVDGNIKEDAGTIDRPIGRHPVDRKRMAVSEKGRNAVTRFRVLERFGTHTLLLAMLETGRTHQIRVHMASILHPVTGDDVYGAKKRQFNLEGQALHGYMLHLAHPGTGEGMDFLSPPPDYFMNVLRKLGSNRAPEEIVAMAETVRRKG